MYSYGKSPVGSLTSTLTVAFSTGIPTSVTLIVNQTSSLILYRSLSVSTVTVNPPTLNVDDSDLGIPVGEVAFTTTVYTPLRFGIE